MRKETGMEKVRLKKKKKIKKDLRGTKLNTGYFPDPVLLAIEV